MIGKPYDNTTPVERIRRNKGFPSTCIDGKPSGVKGIYGISFLDDALGGISPTEFVLIGAPTGVGKTQLCLNLATTNAMAGRKVFFAALEAYTSELEDRLLYANYCKMFYADKNRLRNEYPITIANFLRGALVDVFEPYRENVSLKTQSQLANVMIIYKKHNFTVETLLQAKDEAISKGADFILIDHAHYFDYDLENESQSLTNIVRACRDISQVDGLPVVLVAQLRKKQNNENRILPEIDDFHGTSNLTRIPNTTILFASGTYSAREGVSETFVHVPKARFGDTVKFFDAKMFFDIRSRKYLDHYVIGKCRGPKFEEYAKLQQPEWAYNARSQKEISSEINSKTTI